jgi:hypothetical protein
MAKEVVPASAISLIDPITPLRKSLPFDILMIIVFAKPLRGLSNSWAGKVARARRDDRRRCLWEREADAVASPAPAMNLGLGLPQSHSVPSAASVVPFRLFAIVSASPCSGI